MDKGRRQRFYALRNRRCCNYLPTGFTLSGVSCMGKSIKRALFLLSSIIAWVLASVTTAEVIPPGAQVYVPILVEKQKLIWADAPEPWTLAGLVEQESCISLTHKRCWNPHAELKTAREYGFGFGQITVAYKADGSERFNTFTQLTKQYRSLRHWTWAERYDPGYQLIAVTEMTRNLYNRVEGAATATDRWAFTLSGYNGGAGSVLQDRRYCANMPNCRPGEWFGHVELNSLKSRVAQKGYGGQSWYSINRKHVKNVLLVRRNKYQPYWRHQTWL
jgi:hypothetical protein